MAQEYTQQVSRLAVRLLPLLIQHLTNGEGEDSLNNYVHPIKALGDNLISCLTTDRSTWSRLVNTELVDEIYNSDVLEHAYNAGVQKLDAIVFFKSLDSESCYAIAQFGCSDPCLFLLFYKEFVADQPEAGKWLLNSLFTGRSTLCRSDSSWSDKFTVNNVRTRSISMDSERSDGSYWDQYVDKDTDDEKYEENGSETVKNFQESEKDYYAQYDNVETAVVGEGHSHFELHVEGDHHPVELHMNETLNSLKKLALSSGLSKGDISRILAKHIETIND